MITRHMKGCSTLLVLREIEIKSTVEYHFALEIKAYIVSGSVQLEKMVWQCLIELNLHMPHDLEIPG